jgi:hypothetical protein
MKFVLISCLEIFISGPSSISGNSNDGSKGSGAGAEGDLCICIVGVLGKLLLPLQQVQASSLP